MAEPLTMRRRPAFEWLQFAKLLLLTGAVALAVTYLPNRIWDSMNGTFALVLGGIAAWRYSWWLTHFVRSQIYGRVVFPKLRRKAGALWSRGWRPHRIHFMVVTFRERPHITGLVLDSIVRECEATAIPARIFVGTGDSSDEKVIENYFAEHPTDLPLEVVIVRQNQPGKRFAIGLVLRAISRHGIHPDDLVVFMDGDSILGEGVIERCAPLFALNPKLGAVTTNEEAVVIGPSWMQAWCDMRFAQRRLAMQSHSLSRKVLTLTGRLSLFRAPYVVNEDFIRTIESDQLDHWLWGSFRFLSGDDKSTWFWLLRNGNDMLYVPDAFALTIENVEGNGYERASQNLLRWSGNMLRNGSRALTLGPRRCGLFIWWCLVDQRLSIWTMLTGPLAALLLSLAFGPAVLIGYLVWVLVTRLLLSVVLYFYAGRIYPSFPFLLYANQLLASVIKVHLLFRVSRQRWVNRGDQRSRHAAGRLFRLQNAMAAYLTAFYLSILLVLTSMATGLIGWRLVQSSLLELVGQ
jgi:glycosyltransferase Alg8